MNGLEWRTVYGLTKGLVWCLFPKFHNEGNKHQNNPRVYAWIFHHESKESINNDSNDDLHTSTRVSLTKVYVLLMTSQSTADDETIVARAGKNDI